MSKRRVEERERERDRNAPKELSMCICVRANVCVCVYAVSCCFKENERKRGVRIEKRCGEARGVCNWSSFLGHSRQLLSS